MRKQTVKTGFSLTEVLMAVGILAVAMVFIAGTFPVGVSLTAIATQRPIGAVVADEAFAKIKLYGIDVTMLTMDECVVYDENITDVNVIDPNAFAEEFAYPSANIGSQRKQYYWSALCRDLGGQNVQITIFVSRIGGPMNRYPADDANANDDTTWLLEYPVPVDVDVNSTGSKQLIVTDGREIYINGGSTLIENSTGEIYRVLDRGQNFPEEVLLDRDWNHGSATVWVLPPSTAGRYPEIAVYQTVVEF